MTPETLTAGPLRFVRAARRHAYRVRVEAWFDVIPERQSKDGETVPGKRIEMLRLRAHRKVDGRRFAVQWRGGKADVAYWWTRIHTATATGPVEVVGFVSEHRLPVRVGSTDLAFLIGEMR